MQNEHAELTNKKTKQPSMNNEQTSKVMNTQPNMRNITKYKNLNKPNV